MIKLTDIKKSFVQNKKRIEILKGVNLEIKDSESISILGKSGSGKSTLLSILGGMEIADSGNYEFNNKSLIGINANEWSYYRSKEIGIIFQQFHLIDHLNVLENVTLPLEIQGKKYNECIQLAKVWLKKVELDHRLDHFPATLSGGEKQRVAMARSLIISPKLILADEPSGSLDEKTGDKIMDMVFQITKNENINLLLVTHNKDLAARCDYTYKLENGLLRKI